MQRHYKGVIWTDHALERLGQRGISQGDAWATLNSPEEARYATSKNAWIYYRTYGKERIEVVASQNDKKEWVVISVWSKEIYDNNKRHKKPKYKGEKKGKLARFFGRLVGNKY